MCTGSNAKGIFMKTEECTRFDNYQELMKVILSVEASLIRNCINCEDYFPVVRLFLYETLRSGKKEKTKKHSLFFILSHVISSLIPLISMCAQYLFGQKHSSIFVAPAHHRMNLRNGTYYSKHLDALLRHVNCGNSKVLEYGPASMSPRPIHVRNYTLATVVLCKLLKLPKETLEKLQSVTDVVERQLKCEGIQLNQSINKLNTLLINFEKTTKIYRIFLNRLRIKNLYCVVYYSLDIMAMIRATNNIGGNTIEYQHGVQNDFQPMYTNWGSCNNTPQSIPKIFWMWDEVSKKRIQNWATKHDRTVIVVGNLWYTYFVESKKEVETFYLVALQKVPEFFNFDLLEVIKKTPDVNWLFREHPLSPAPVEFKEKLLCDFSNIEFDTNFSIGIEERLRFTTVCFTGFSTVGIEAINMGKKVIFTHKNALNGLKPYLDGESGFYANNSDQILRLLRSF